MRCGALWLVALLGAEIVVAAPASALTLVPPFSTWSYRDTPTGLPADWIQTGYDDSGWPSGPGVLGYGDPFITTVIPYGPDPNNKWRTTYFRKSFTVVGDPALFTTMSLLVNYDDGFVLYLNGNEVIRRSMPAGPIVYSTFAMNHAGGGVETFNVSTALPWLVQGQNQLAVEVHQATVNSSDLALDVELRASTGATEVVRGPYLQIGGSDRVTVRWRTSVATDSRVTYGDADPGPIENVVDDPAIATEHQITLTDLTPSGRYRYSIGTTQAVLAGGGPDHTIVTAPPVGPAAPTRLWILGDSGTANQNARAVRDAYAAYVARSGRTHDLWLMLGDNAYDAGTDVQYQAAVFDMYPTTLRTSSLWPTRGNHDALYAGGSNDYYDAFSLPVAAEVGGLPSGTEAYYSFDRANIHFICLDSEGTDRSLSGAMLQWLREDLAATPREWVIAFWHHPPYTKGSHNSDDAGDSGGRMRDMRANALPILDSAGVDVVLTGHSHAYERSVLLDGHYDTSNTLVPSMVIDGGDGSIDGDGAYEKATLGTGPHEGAVYAVAGSSGQISGGTLDHPAMTISLNALGSMVIDVDGPRLDARFLDGVGAVRDSFTMIKGGTVSAPPVAQERHLSLQAPRPNPSRGETRVAFVLPTASPVRFSVLDASGRTVRVLADGPRPAGRHELRWDGRDDRGRALGAGVFFVVLDTGVEITSRKLTRIR